MRLQFWRPGLLVSLAAVTVVLLFHAEVTRAQQVPWIKLERGPAYELTDTANKVTIPVPVTVLSGVKTEEIKLKLRDARIGSRSEIEATEAFTVPAGVSVTERSGPSINIEVELAKIPSQGAYSLLIEARSPQQPEPQILELQITRPAAKLQVTGAIVVEQVLTPFGSPEDGAKTLVMRETTERSRLTDIKIQPLDFTGDHNQSITGSLSFTGLPAEIGRGGRGEANYRITGDFPLGTSKGVVMISAPQLVEPVPVDVEVRTRRACWLIFVIILAGLLLWYVSRVLLQTQIQLN